MEINNRIFPQHQKILKTSRNATNYNKMRKGAGLKGITSKTVKEGN